jgi:hypothetical protein
MTAYASAAKLKEALANLPILDFPAACGIVRGAVAGLRQQDLKPAARLEYLGPLLVTCCQLLATHGRSQGTKRSRETERIRQQRLRELSLALTELFHAAQYTINHMETRRRFPWQRPPPLAEALHLALHTLSRLMMCGYLQYIPGARNLWKDLHDTLSLVERSGQLDTPVTLLAPIGGALTSTCTRIFVQTMLISLADPHRMSQEILWDCDLQLAAWSHLVTLQPYQPPEDLYGFFVVDPASPGPPLRLERLAKDADQAACRLLDCLALIATTESHLLLLEEHRTLPKDFLLDPAGARRALLQLLKGLTSPRARREPRQRTEGRHRLAFGVIAAHYFISGELAFTPTLMLPSEATGQGEQAPATPLGRADVLLQEWSIFDVSPNGFCIYSRDTDQPIRIGELLAIAQPAAPGTKTVFGLGTARWQMCQTQILRKVGIEILSRKVVAVAIRALQGSPIEKEPRRAFLLGNPFDDDDSTVVVSGILFAPERHLSMEIAGSWYKVIARDLVDASDHYERFSLVFEEQEPLSGSSTILLAGSTPQ